jgi:hypothetical protein
MYCRRSTLSVIAAALALTAIAAEANNPPPPPPGAVQFDGHYYEIVVANKISWEDARAAAEQRTFQGIQGHLATIGTAQEDAFIDQLRKQFLSASHPALSGTELWVGGYQVKCTETPEPGCGWLWLNGEAISPVSTASPYTNWQSGEPNNLVRTPDAFTRATEDFLAIGRDGNFGWNDEGYLPNVWGYVVEYGDKVTVDADTCTSEAGGCNPSGGQILEYPETAKVDDGATLTAQTFRIHDDPNRCGNQPLTLFNGAVVIPPYLCGHPDFLVIKTTSAGVDVLTGAIDVENLTAQVLPNNLFGCTAVRQNPAGVVDPDPSHRDVVAWQSDDPSRMPESSLGTGRFFGTLAEVTYGCGSSRGKVVNGSYHFVGLRIHPGPGNELADGNPQGNHQSFIELTRYKLDLLRASVVASKVALPKKQHTVLMNAIDATIDAHTRRHYDLALVKLKVFQFAVEHSDYRPIPGENFNGDHIMRASNLEFMYEEKIIPFD